MLSYLKDRLHCRLNSWFLRKLSHGGKEVLLKSTAAALPVYPMSCFRLPKTIIKKLESMMADYWWNSEPHLKKIHWISWDRLCLPKKLGGLGFKDLECFNQALLAKQAWKLVIDQNSLMARFLKSRYFPHSTFLDAQSGARPSYAWRSLIYGRELVKKGLKKSIGDGYNTSVWLDKWVDDPELGPRPPWIKCISFDVNLMVKDLIDHSSRKWNVSALQAIFFPRDVELILSKQPAILHEDSVTWAHNKSGSLTVKSAYWLARNQKIKECYPEVLSLPSVNPVREKVWKITSAPKIKTFLWKAVSEALPVAELILRRGMKIDNRCQTCGSEEESILHVLFHCAPARQVWALSGIPHPKIGFDEGSLLGNVSYLLSLKTTSRLDEKMIRVWPWILWSLWKSRNELIFKGRRWSPEEIKEKADCEAEEWFLAQEVEEEFIKTSSTELRPPVRRWKPPPRGWLMCNVSLDWVKHSKLLGVAWVVRNERGVVMMHSRRAFSNIHSLDDARLTTLLWAIESMSSLHYNQVIFAGDFRDLFLAFKKPLQWPALRYQVDELGLLLSLISDFKLLVVSKEENRGATIIAQSVTREGRLQSYVASGHPSWLFEFFVNESRFL